MTEMVIEHRTGDYHGDGSDLLIWEIRDERGVCSALYITDDQHREVANVETRDDCLRQGMARALFRAAEAAVGAKHAPVAHRTDEGQLFAAAVGGETAEYPCDCYGCTYEEDEEN